MVTGKTGRHRGVDVVPSWGSRASEWTGKRLASPTKRVLGKSMAGQVISFRPPLECLMTPKTFAEQMRQARSKSPLLKREQALKQFAEVEAFLDRHSLRPSVKPSASGLKARGA